jgi:hypothetical protein
MAVSGGLAGAIDGGVLTPTSDTDFVKGRLLNAAIGGISGAAGIGAGAAINILADGAAGAITSTAVRMGGNMAVGAGSGAVTAEASALASDGRWATQSELSLAFATGVAGGALSIFGGAPHFAGTDKLPVSPAGPIDVAGRPVAPPEPPSAYKPEVFKDKPYEVNFNGDTRTVQPSSVTAWQTLDEGERINLGVSLNFQAGEVKGYLTHESFGSATDPVHAPISAIRDGLEVRVNGQKVDWPQQQAAGFTGPAYMEWSAPASGGPVKVDLSFYGRPIGKYSLDPTSGTLTRLEQSKQLSVLDIRQFHQQPNYAGEWQKHVDEETLRLARENNVIIEFNANSNVALRNIDGTGELPIKQYLNAGVRVTLGTDGHGMYRTSARSEEAVMRSLGLTDEDFAKITRSDQLYLEMMKHPERLRLRPAA